MSEATPVVAAATPEHSVKVAALTEYVILKQDGEEPNDGWIVTAESVKAPTSEKALRKCVGMFPDSEQDGTYVAVPARSWSPVKVTLKREPTLVIEEAK